MRNALATATSHRPAGPTGIATRTIPLRRAASTSPDHAKQGASLNYARGFGGIHKQPCYVRHLSTAAHYASITPAARAGYPVTLIHAHTITPPLATRPAPPPCTKLTACAPPVPSAQRHATGWPGATRTSLPPLFPVTSCMSRHARTIQRHATEMRPCSLKDQHTRSSPPHPLKHVSHRILLRVTPTPQSHAVSPIARPPPLACTSRAHTPPLTPSAAARRSSSHP